LACRALSRVGASGDIGAARVALEARVKYSHQYHDMLQQHLMEWETIQPVQQQHRTQQQLTADPLVQEQHRTQQQLTADPPFQQQHNMEQQLTADPPVQQQHNMEQQLTADSLVQSREAEVLRPRGDSAQSHFDLKLSNVELVATEDIRLVCSVFLYLL